MSGERGEPTELRGCLAVCFFRIHTSQTKGRTYNVDAGSDRTRFVKTAFRLVIRGSWRPFASVSNRRCTRRATRSIRHSSNTIEFNLFLTPWHLGGRTIGREIAYSTDVQSLSGLGFEVVLHPRGDCWTPVSRCLPPLPGFSGAEVDVRGGGGVFRGHEQPSEGPEGKADHGGHRWRP